LGKDPRGKKRGAKGKTCHENWKKQKGSRRNASPKDKRKKKCGGPLLISWLERRKGRRGATEGKTNIGGRKACEKPRFLEREGGKNLFHQ